MDCLPPLQIPQAKRGMYNRGAEMMGTAHAWRVRRDAGRGMRSGIGTALAWCCNGGESRFVVSS
jgi:hypothetical protein